MASGLLYALITLHVSASLRQEIEAFILVPPGAPMNYASIYFAQEGAKMALLKNIVYSTAVSIYSET